MKFYRWLYLVSAAIILTACGGPIADAPAAVAEGDPLVESLITEAETLGIDLSVQNNGKNYRYIKVGKKVEGYAPHDAKYKFILACKKGKKYVVVIKTELYVGKYKEFKIPDYYWECFAIEYGKVGDYVKFDVYQSHKHNWKESYHTYKGKYEAPKYEHHYGRYVASKTLYLTKKYVKIDVTNKYEARKKPLEIDVTKLYRSGYNDTGSLSPKNVYLDLKLICENGTEVSLALGKKDYSQYADKVRGQKCYIKERFYSDDYTTKQFRVTYENYKHSYLGSKGETYNDCTTSYDSAYHKDYDHCQSNDNGKTFHIVVDPHTTRLVIIIVDRVELKKPKFELVVKKEFREGYNNPDQVYPNSDKYYLNLQLICDGDVVVEIGNNTHYKDYDAPDLAGRNCEIKEKFYDYEYQTVQYSIKYDDAKDPSYADCKTEQKYGDDKAYDYCEYNRFYVNKDAKKLILIIKDNVQHRYHPHASS